VLHAANNVALMDMIMEYLDHEGQKSSTFASPVQPLGPHVKIWAESLPEFDASPISNPPPSYQETEFSDSTERSFSPMGSMFSDTSSYEEEEGCRTPPTPIDPLRSSLVYSNDVKHPETPSSALPEALIVIPKSIYHSKRESPVSPLSPISRTPIEPTMQATITNLVDIMPECMEEFIPEASPVKRSSTNRKPGARLSLKRKPVARLQIQIPTTSVSPIEEVTPTPQPRPYSAAIPPLHVGEMLVTHDDIKAPKPVRHSTPVPVLGKKLLRNLEIEARNSAPVRSPIISLPPVVSRTKQQQIEKIPPPKTETKSQDDEAVAFGTNMGIWFTKGFFAGGAGLTLTMSRRYLTYSKMEWVVENEDGSGFLKCYSQTNSLSRRTGMCGFSLPVRDALLMKARLPGHGWKSDFPISETDGKRKDRGVTYGSNSVCCEECFAIL
jgi:hypothetical protein